MARGPPCRRMPGLPSKLTRGLGVLVQDGEMPSCSSRSAVVPVWCRNSTFPCPCPPFGTWAGRRGSETATYQPHPKSRFATNAATMGMAVLLVNQRDVPMVLPPRVAEGPDANSAGGGRFLFLFRLAFALRTRPLGLTW